MLLQHLSYLKKTNHAKTWKETCVVIAENPYPDLVDQKYHEMMAFECKKQNKKDEKQSNHITTKVKVSFTYERVQIIVAVNKGYEIDSV